MRRNLSGIYIFDQFPEEEKRSPTCIEDCQYETRERWLQGLEKEALVRTCHHLCETLSNIGEQFDIIAK